MNASLLARANGLLRADFFRHGALIFASTTFVNLGNYAFHFYTSRALGVIGYGALSSLLAMLMLATIPAMVAASTIAKYAASFSAFRDAPALRTFGRRVVTYAGLIATVVCVLGLAASGALATYLNLPDTRSTVLLTMIAGIQFVSFAARGVLQGVQDFRRFAVATTSEIFLKLALGVALVSTGFGVTGALLGYAIASVLSLAYALAVIHRRAGDGPGGPLNIRLGGLIKTTGAIGVSTAALHSLAFSDLVLVKHFLDPRLAGLYGALSLVGKTFFFVVSFVPTIVLPKAADRAARGQSTLPLLAQAAVAIVSVAGLGLGFVFLFPTFTIALMAGPAFLAAGPYVLPYASAMTLLAATNIAVSYRTGLHTFTFVVPLVAIAVGEIVALQFIHRTLGEIVSVVLVGHAIAFLCVVYRITAVRAVPYTIKA